MRRSLWALAAAGLGVFVYAQTSAGQLLANYAKALSEAKTLRASYTIQTVAGAPRAFQLELAKPNLARLDGPTETIVADGTTIVRYDKANKTYYKEAQTDAALRGLLSPDAYAIWSAFFHPDSLSKCTVKALGNRSFRGTPVTGVEASFDDGKKKVIYYLATSDNVTRQAEIAYSDQSDNERLIVNTRSVELGVDIKPELFAFKAPEGSRELTEEERYSNVWYEDLEEAKKVAAKTKRLVFIDFWAEW
jgi:outer membrane lipoprotein-sorting protein